MRRRWRRRRLLLLQYSGSRKSQINPFVIPHRSFQSVRISSTRFYATSAPSQNSSPFLFRLPAVLLKRRELLLVSYLSLSLFLFLYLFHITLFSPFFSLISLPVYSRRIFSISLARLRAQLLFFFESYSFAILRPYRVISCVLLPRCDSCSRVTAARPGRVCFVCFSCASLNSDFLGIHAYRHYDIWHRDAAEMGSTAFEITFVTVKSANRNWSSCGGERDKEIY